MVDLLLGVVDRLVLGVVARLLGVCERLAGVLLGVVDREAGVGAAEAADFFADLGVVGSALGLGAALGFEAGATAAGLDSVSVYTH